MLPPNYFRPLLGLVIALLLPALSPLLAQLPPGIQTQSDSLAKLAQSADSDTLQIQALSEQARVLAPFDSDSNEALHLQVIDFCSAQLKEQLPQVDSLFYRKKMAVSQTGLGVNYYLVGNFPQALRYNSEGIDGLEALGLDQFLGKAYVVMGAIHKRIGDIELSLKDFEQSLEVSRRVDNKNGMGLALNNIGLYHFDRDSFDLAERIFREAIALYEETGNQRGQSVEYLNLGNVFEKQQDWTTALETYQRSLDLREAINDKIGQIYSNARVGQLHLRMGRVDQALKSALRSVELAEERQYPRALMESNELLFKVYRQQGRFDKALQHYEAYVTARDSLAGQEQVRASTQAEYSYQFEKQLAADSIRNAEAQKTLQVQIDLRDSENRRQQLVGRFLLAGIAIAVLLGVFIYTRFRQAEKQKRIIESQKAQVEEALAVVARRDEEKELLLKEIHHRVKNNLQVISSLLDLQTQNLEDEIALSAVADGQNRVKAMALIHEKLYQNEDIARLDFKDYVKQLVVQIAAIFPGGRDVERNISGPDVELDIDTAIPLGLILSELLTNVFKYARSKGHSTRIDIQLSETEKGLYSLDVRDNGPGMPDDFDLKKAKSLGLRLVRRLSRQLYGTASYRNDGGAVFTITFQDTFRRKAVE